MGLISSFEDVDIDDIIIDRFQVRAANVGGDELQELADSIREFGLLHPITLCRTEVDPSKWEVVAGQRRMLAHKLLGERMIKAGLIDKVLTLEEGLAVSGNENVHQLDMSRRDMIDLCNRLYNIYGALRVVADKTKIPYDVVRKYVRYVRLEENLKELVDDGKLDLDVAIKSQDACTIRGKLDEKRALELALEAKKADDDLRSKLFKLARKDISTPINQLKQLAEKPDVNLTVQFHLGEAESEAIRNLAAEQGADTDVVCQEIVEEQLRDMGLVLEEN